jgi:exopolyphosphatase/guanosine-5'-triphosphate,3'-diphosphate pyrophosphatase
VTIVPRWEWRTFGESFGTAEERFAELTMERVQESDEIYILSTVGDASVKVRDALMDVKRLEAVNGDGLEQWIPIMKGEFPLGAADIATLYTALGVSGAPAGETVSLDELLAAVGASGELRAVDVHKRRERYTVGGCISELSELSADGHATRTIAVELEDPALVSAAVRWLGLDPRENTCMARGLKALVGLG